MRYKLYKLCWHLYVVPSLHSFIVARAQPELGPETRVGTARRTLYAPQDQLIHRDQQI